PLDLAAKPQSADQGRSLERLEIAQPDARADGRGVLVCPHERVVASLDPAEELTHRYVSYALRHLEEHAGGKGTRVVDPFRYALAEQDFGRTLLKIHAL